MLASCLVSGECKRHERSLDVAQFEGEISENEVMSIRFSAGFNFVDWPTTIALDGGKGNAFLDRKAQNLRYLGPAQALLRRRRRFSKLRWHWGKTNS
jgi:hypothetical protein